MKVRVIEEVTIDKDVNVSVDDLLAECWDRIGKAECDEASEAERRYVLGVVDSALQILSDVPDCVLELAPRVAITEVLRRLDVERKRWAALEPEQEG